MKTHSAPSTAIPQTSSLTATVVPDHQRSRFWPLHFGRIPQWLILESHVFGWLDRLCADYNGGSWDFYTLDNGGHLWPPKSMAIKSGRCSTV